MAIHNAEIADIFTRLADLLEIEGADPFRIRAYRNAAREISGLSKSVVEMVRHEEDLTKLPSIGDALAKKIKIIVETGELPQLKQVEKRIPKGLSDLVKIPALGPKRVKILYQDLHVRGIKDLQRAIKSGKILEHEGFGQKIVATIEKALKHFKPDEQRTKLAEAEFVADVLTKFLKSLPGVKIVEVAGSFRRRCDTVGDLDILVVAKNGAAVINEFAEYEEVKDIVSKGTTRSTVHLRSGLQVDLRVVPQISYGAALLYFTGSKAHNIAIRTIAVKKKIKINEYGAFKEKKRIAGKTEKEIYKLVGVPYIEPELREDRGEIEAAKKGRLPKLITLDDIRGDLHCHTKETDGVDTLKAMVDAAIKKGYEYMAITDHSKHLTVAHGMDKKRVMQQIKVIDKLNAKLKNFVILKAIECDILEDGTLDLPDEVLNELDLTVCSVHFKFGLTQKQQTERILRAMDNPNFNIFAHPSGRLINKREAYNIDLEKVMHAAKERGCILEMNAQPERMDLNDLNCKIAKEVGVKMVISTDSHSTSQLDNMRFGVSQARRGWLEKKDVLNTLTLSKLLKALKR